MDEAYWTAPVLPAGMKTVVHLPRDFDAPTGWTRDGDTVWRVMLPSDAGVTFVARRGEPTEV